MESSKKRALKICLMVEHIDRTKEMPANTVYMIEPPTDAADYDAKQIDSDGFFMDAISPVVTIHNDDDLLLKHCAMVRLESRIYFFGGISDIYDYDIHSNINHPHPLADELKLAVRFFDVDHPELGLRSAASLRAPKEIPCVFSARGMIYALGSSRKVCNSTFDHLDDDDGTSVWCSGIFERYDPRDDQWKLLPDPPLPFGEMTRFGVTYCDSATLIADRYVFIGNTLPKVFLIFDLDQLKWSSLPPFSLLATQFPYGSLCVDNSLYYLVGYGSDKPGTQWDTRSNWLDQKEAEDEDYDGYDDYDAVNLQIVKRGPLLLLADDDDDPSKLVNSLCLRPRYNKQVMTRLYQVPFLLDLNCSEWRDIFHLGGRFFCCVVTSQLFSSRNLNRSQPYCRGVWIDVLEEVELPASKSTEFRTLASFPYRIRTPFKNRGIYIRCCAFGSVPDSVIDRGYLPVIALSHT